MAELTDEERITRYTALVNECLALKKPEVTALFLEALHTRYPTEMHRLHIEIFPDREPFNVAVLAMDNTNCQMADPPGVLGLNAGLEALWPLLTDDDLNPLIVWEEDEHGPLHALSQPIDAVDVGEMAKAWFAEITAAARERSAVRVSVAVHDTDTEHRLI